MDDLIDIISEMCIEIDGSLYISNDVCNVIIHSYLAKRVRRGRVIHGIFELPFVILEEDESIEQLN